jgi:hypothetical protein
MVKDLRAALDEVEVTVGGRVEGAGIESFDGHSLLQRDFTAFSEIPCRILQIIVDATWWSRR